MSPSKSFILTGSIVAPVRWLLAALHALPGGQVAVRVRLLDVAKQAQLAAYTETVPAEQLRAAAHRIADMIYEKLTGDVGVFSTRIAYVVKAGKKICACK